MQGKGEKASIAKIENKFVKLPGYNLVCDNVL